MAFTTPNAIQNNEKKSKSSFACFYCKPPAEAQTSALAPSENEIYTVSLLHNIMKNYNQYGLEVVTESRVLGKKFGPTDFSVVSTQLPRLRLEIEVDGEQHFGKGYKRAGSRGTRGKRQKKR